MTVKRIIAPEILKSDMKQNWTSTEHGYYDQFHFEIERAKGYKLFWHGNFIVETHSLNAAKEISTILLNDKILAG